MRELEITNLEENQRFDKFLLKYLNTSTKSYVYKMLRKKRIKLNNSRADGNEMLKDKDTVQMYLSDETIESFMAIKSISKKAGILSVIYEDENILICDKPAGILSHSETSDDNDTMVDRILLYLKKKGEYDNKNTSTFTPSICNRLDRNTSGIVIAGKNLKSLQHLNEMFRERNVDKYYTTIVKGNITKKGVIKGYHSKDNSTNTVYIGKNSDDNTKEVITEYTPISSTENFSMISIKLITGKTHQIRAHMQTINHEIVGDTKYGDRKVNEFVRSKIGLKNQLLHNERIIFKDENGFLNYLYKKEFICKLPDIFKKAIVICIK